jgi:hypothetical protein
MKFQTVRKDRKSNGPWVKLYRSTLHDYKVRELSEANRWRFIGLILLTDSQGELPEDTQQIAFELGIDSFEWAPFLLFLEPLVDQMATTGRPVVALGCLEERRGEVDIEKKTAFGHDDHGRDPEGKGTNGHDVDNSEGQGTQNGHSKDTEGQGFNGQQDDVVTSNFEESYEPGKSIEDRFEEFWSLYPRKVKKARCQVLWKTKVKSNEDSEAVIAGLIRAKKSQQWIRDRGKYIPHPSTWLFNEQWNDEDGTTDISETRRMEGTAL